MELQRQSRSSGVAKGGLTTGIIGTALGALNSVALMGAGVNAATRNSETVDVVAPVNPWGWGPGYGFAGSWGGAWGNPWYGQTPQTVVVNSNEEGRRNGRYSDNEGCGCSENMLVNRYELGLEQKIAEKDSQIALRDANTYNDQKMLEMYKYIDGQLKDVRNELCRQAVVNQKTEDSFALVQKDVQCCCDRLAVQIERERDERKCADNAIITYTNATFYPKMVADVTTGTTTTAQTTYNPLPCQCSCGNNNR
ncbi:MAG: hypothetical protein K2N51_15090 [Lachnospiraceae bacterium]|nr:hypothetical protein [Lachnospiraceae bacterium]